MDINKEIIDIFSALLTPTIGLFGMYIAFQQWLTNERKRKQDLFEKRWDLYKRIRAKFFELVSLCFKSDKHKEKYYFWGEMFYNETIPKEYEKEFREQQHKSYIFYEFREEISFLFGEEVYSRLECLQNEAMQNLYKNYEMNDYFEDYFKDVFSKYLCIEPRKNFFRKINPQKFAEQKRNQVKKVREKFIKDICKNQVNKEDSRENRGKI